MKRASQILKLAGIAIGVFALSEANFAFAQDQGEVTGQDTQVQAAADQDSNWEWIGVLGLLGLLGLRGRRHHATSTYRESDKIRRTG